jgi:uncharacterized membrane protein
MKEMKMGEYRVSSPIIAPGPSLIRMTHLIYFLHAFSVLMGVLGPALIITTFLSGWPSIIAVIINYIRRNDVRGTYLDSHFSWQIRTFWYALFWLVVAALLFATVIGIVLAYILAVGVGFWIVYRVLRGWIALDGGRSVPA